MPTDLTGTPTTLGIGTFNVDADAPSGLGFNEAMTQIDALIAGRLTTPAGILTGEIPVWNGSTWVRSSTLGMAPSGISGYPNSVAKFLRGDGAWVFPGVYRKTSPKQVVNSAVETDLLNSEITVGAGVLGTNGVLRLTAWGDMVNNTGGTQSTPRWKVKLGASTLLDSGIMGAVWTSSATRAMWRLGIEIAELNATNAQWASMSLEHNAGLGANAIVFFTTGTGQYQAFVTAAGWGFWKAEGGGAGTVDTTTAQALAVTVTLPVANAALDVTLKGAVVEII